MGKKKDKTPTAAVKLDLETEASEEQEDVPSEVGPLVSDRFACLPRVKAFTATMITPEGKEYDLALKAQRELGAYEIAYDCTIKGEHVVKCQLNGEHINCSPYSFKVTPGNAVVSKSRLRQVGPAIVNLPCELVLELVDKYGNKLEGGGTNAVGARGLGTGVGACAVTDNGDGTHKITFTSSVVGECRIAVRLDNTEMPQLSVTFDQDKGARNAAAEAPAAAPSPAEEPVSIE